MKETKEKLILTFFLIASVIFFKAIEADAAPSYGIGFPKKNHFESGIETNHIFKRTLKKNAGKIKSHQYFIDLSYGITEWLSLDGKIGVGDIRLKEKDPYDLDLDTGFAGGYGFRMKLLKPMPLILGFQHISIHPGDQRMGGTKYEAVLDDWQVSILTAKEFKRIFPYIGVKLSQVYLIQWINKSKSRTGSEDIFGVIFGIDFLINQDSRINIEARIIDEYAASIFLMTKF